MADIKISCVSCGKLFEVSETAAGRNVKCPACDNTIIVEPAENPDSAKLKIKKKLKFCSECGAALPENRVCASCSAVPEKPVASGSGNSPWLLAVVVLAMAIAVLAAGLAGYLWYATRAIPTPEDTSEVFEPISAPDTFRSREARRAHKSFSEPDPKLDPVEARIRAETKERLDQRSPIAMPGERIELRRNNGMFHSGVFVGVKDDHAVLRRPDGEEVAIPLNELDSPSLAKCDMEHRSSIFEQAVRKQLDAVKSPF